MDSTLPASAATAFPRPSRARDLTGDEQALFDRLTKEHAWRLQVPDSAPFRTRTVPNPGPRDYFSTAGDMQAIAVVLGILGVVFPVFGWSAWGDGHRVQGGLFVLLGLAVLGTVAVLTTQDFRRGRDAGTSARLVVPETVANAYLSFRETVAAISQIQTPGAVADYLTEATGHMDRLVAQAHRLHRQGFSRAAVGDAVREEMVEVSAETAALVDVLLGNPADRTEAIAWKQTQAALRQHPQVEDEDRAIAAAFDAYHQALSARQD